ncbi:MAG: DUF5132 domain-containing protein [Deltaproteobacteria bacterium]|nr:DUF5132 domain-containing protein [Deltaproteobacteria bacterium]
MAFLDDLLKGNVVTALAIGIGAAVLAPVVVPLAAAVVKPLAKAAIKGGLIILEKGKETLAEMSEVAEDLVAEAKAEAAKAKETAAVAEVAGAVEVEARG